MYFLFSNYAFPFLQDYFDNSIEVSPLIFNSALKNDSEIWLDFCELPEVDPWDPTIMEYIKPEKDHMLNCTRKLPEHSKLINGQLFIYSNESDAMNCQMRCLLPKGDWKIRYKSWKKVENGTKPECDVIEIECQKDGTIYYKYIHVQIYRSR
uniref:Uncharacterized protein n=1 Tax=Panagrolaimus superbus TaxID=310955 RepID=A0A914Z2T2_9BILA